MPVISIQRLDVSLRGISPATAQSAIAGLGPALAQALAAQPLNPAASGPLHIGHLDLAPIRVGTQPTANALSTTLARQIASTVSRHVGPNQTL